MYTIFFTGLSGSGKTTTAIALKKRLESENKKVFLLDGDIIRDGLCSDLKFTKEDREENIRRIGHLCILLNNLGYIVLATFISPYKKDREFVKNLHKENKILYYECFMCTSIETCIYNDVKGLYKKALNGEIPNFTGISAPYEEPEEYDFKLNHDNSIKENIEKIMNELDKNVSISKIDLEWIQVLKEGWADPLSGFMKEKDYLTSLHFNHIERDGKYYNQSIPIILSTDKKIENGKEINLIYENRLIGKMKDIECYSHNVNEMINRLWGTKL